MASQKHVVGELGGRGAAEVAGPDPLTGPYGDLRAEAEAWLGAGGDTSEGGSALAEALSAVDPLLTRSYLLTQPNVAGMGVAAWGLAVADPTQAARQIEGRVRRMLGRAGGPVQEQETTEEDDPDALLRGADLMEARARLAEARLRLPADAPPALVERLAALDQDLGDRLRRERRLSPTLDARLRRRDASVVALRRTAAGARAPEPSDEAPVLAQRGSGGVYEATLDRTVAEEPAPPALTALRSRIGAAAERLGERAGEDARSRRRVEQIRRLLAEETVAAGGAPGRYTGGVDTEALRRQLAALPGDRPRPLASSGPVVRPVDGAPEVPIRENRRPDAPVVGYLRADEALSALRRVEGFVRVPVPGRRRPGWIDAEWVEEAGAEQNPLTQALNAATGAGDAVGEVARAPTQARGAEGRSSGVADPSERAVSIERITITGLGDADLGAATPALTAALRLLPERVALRRAGQAGPGRPRADRVGVDVTVALDGQSIEARALRLADELAAAVVAAGAAQISEIALGVRTVGGADAIPAQERLISNLATGDAESVADLLRAERKTLDAATHARLTRFFGHDFSDVMIFAGPMSGALARSLQAEALTHGKAVFFDPKHFRTDTARGEALMAHELTHTRQREDRDVRAKEAEAMITEVAYLDWLQPGGAPLARDLSVEPTAPWAAAAADVRGGAMRAASNRPTAGGGDPRGDVAEREVKVQEVLDTVVSLLAEEREREGDRIGALVTSFSGPI